MTVEKISVNKDERYTDLELTGDVIISVFQTNDQPRYVAFLKIQGESAILEGEYLWDLLRKIARTILAWGETE